jgi:hypothetical protein
MFTSIAFLFTLLAVYKKQSSWFYIALFSFGFLCFSLAIDGNFLGWWDYMYVKDNVENTPVIIYFWTIYLFGFLTFSLLLQNKPVSILGPSTVHNPRDILIYSFKLRRIGYLLFYLSLLATIINVVRAGDITILFVNARDWELAFGQNVLLNYIYFLHLPALVIFAIILGRGNGRKYDWLIVLILISLTVFHGIKFTILHGFLFFLFAFYLSKKEQLSKIFYFGGIILFILVLIFFIFVRGGGAEGLFGYIVSASINSMYIVNNFEFYEIGEIGSFVPVSIEFFEKAFYRLQGVFPPKPDGLPPSFMLNDSFNLQSAITKTGIGFGLGFIFASAILALIINYQRASDLNYIHNLFFLTFIMEVTLFTFTGWELFKFKLWFAFFITVSIHYYLKFRMQYEK